MSILGAAVFQPWRAWPRILAERREATWMYVAAGVESLLMRPEVSVRAIWAVARRGPNAVMSVLRLASVQIIWIILFAALLALILRVLRRSGGFGMGELMGLTPWAYAPKLAVTLAFVAGWLVGVVPESAFVIDGFQSTPAWAAAYHALSAVAVGVSIVSLLRQHVGPLPKLTRLTPVLIAMTGVAVAGVATKAAMSPERFRPVGTGDRVRVLRFAALSGEPLTIDFPTDKPVVIDFWASWCGPCVDALPEWQALRSDTVTLVSANVEMDNTEYVKQFLRENKYTFPVVLAGGTLQSRFQVETLPTVVKLSKDGEVTHYQVGRTNVRALLQE